MRSTESQQPTAPMLIGYGCLSVLFPMLMSLFALWVLRLFVGTNLAAWWRDTFGDPVFRAVAYVTIRTGGDTGTTLLISTLPFFAILWTARTAQGSVTRRSFESMQAGRWLSQDLDAARDELRRIFSDDPEQIALYQTRVSDPSTRYAHRHPAAFAAFGCLPSMALGLFLGPVTFLASLAMYDSLLRLTDMFEASRTLAQSAGPLASQLAPLVPLDQTAFGFDLTQRSLLLTLVVGTVAFLTWVVTTMPRAALMWPTGISRGSVISFLIGLTLIYVFANSLVLLLMGILASFNLAMLLALRIVRPVRLRAAGMWSRIRRAPTSAAVEAAADR